MELQNKLAHEEQLKQFLADQLPHTWSTEAIAYIQENDPDLKKVRAWVRAGHEPTWEELAPESVAVKSWWYRFSLLHLSPDNDILYLQRGPQYCRDTRLWQLDTCVPLSGKSFMTPKQQATLVNSRRRNVPKHRYMQVCLTKSAYPLPQLS